ncbi:hypothetical protein ACP6PL_18440 [Dapis sp. BLCC M126]|uniref:hypothetical protein n=1 Tax=Dapis sp. BLCC M126 TaxID=3400189 RepID=UPI003CE7F908
MIIKINCEVEEWLGVLSPKPYYKTVHNSVMVLANLVAAIILRLILPTYLTGNRKISKKNVPYKRREML